MPAVFLFLWIVLGQEKEYITRARVKNSQFVIAHSYLHLLQYKR